MKMCHGTIDSDLIEFHSWHDQNYGTLKILNGNLMRNRWFGYGTPKISNRWSGYSYNEMVEFEKQSGEARNFVKITNNLKGV